jgi:hypothetical protein
MSFSEGLVGRFEVVANDTTPDRVFALPNGYDFDFRLTGSAANSARVQQSNSSNNDVDANTATWASLDASLDSVGTTTVLYRPGVASPYFFRVSRTSAGQTATLVVTYKKRRD